MLFFYCFIFFSACTLSRLTVTNKDIRLFSCYQCEFKTIQADIIGQHMMAHNVKSRKKNKTPFHLVQKQNCNIKRESSLDVCPRQTVNLNESDCMKMFCCDICGIQYEDLHSLECHRKYVHQIEITALKVI